MFSQGSVAERADQRVAAEKPHAFGPTAPLHKEGVHEPGERYTSFTAFYPFYQSQHRDTLNRALHVLGTLLVLVTLAGCVLSGNAQYIFPAVATGYGCAWIGHFCVERNRPATFTYPLWSLAADSVMTFNILTGREPLSMADAAKS